MKYFDELHRVVIMEESEIVSCPKSNIVYYDYDEGTSCEPETLTVCFDTLPETWY